MTHSSPRKRKRAACVAGGWLLRKGNARWFVCLELLIKPAVPPSQHVRGIYAPSYVTAPAAVLDSSRWAEAVLRPDEESPRHTKASWKNVNTSHIHTAASAVGLARAAHSDLGYGGLPHLFVLPAAHRRPSTKLSVHLKKQNPAAAGCAAANATLYPAGLGR